MKSLLFQVKYIIRTSVAAGDSPDERVLTGHHLGVPRRSSRLGVVRGSFGVERNVIINLMTTVDRRDALEQMGRVLLQKRLVACVQIVGPVKSTYWWKGSLEETEEWIGVMKTKSELYSEAEKELKAMHPYEVPEIIAVEATNVLAAYEKWIVDETGALKNPDDAFPRGKSKDGPAVKR